MKVLISVCGEGFGHASRGLAIQRALEARGHEGVLACYGKALERIRNEGAEAIETFPEIQMAGADGRFDLAASFMKSTRAPLNVLKSYFQEKAFIERNDIDVVIADSRLSATVAGHLAKRPTLYVCNQNHFVTLSKKARHHRARHIYERIKSLLDVAPPLIDRLMQSPLPFADYIVVPDFPPPDTLCLPLLSTKKPV